jgi:hypothetical protein
MPPNASADGAAIPAQDDSQTAWRDETGWRTSRSTFHRSVTVGATSSDRIGTAPVIMIRRRGNGACGRMTEIQPETPAPLGPKPSPPPHPIEDPPIGDPPPEGPEVPIGAPRRTHAAIGSEEGRHPLSEAEQLPSGRDLQGPEDTLAGTGDGTEGPDAPDEPGPRPPGFPDLPGDDEDASGEHT